MTRPAPFGVFRWCGSDEPQGDAPLATTRVPPDLDQVLDDAWEAAEKVPGYLGENEARFLGLIAACVPARGVIAEIGSYKGRSTVMLAKVAAHYGLGPVVAIDPHNSPILLNHQDNAEASSYQDFLNSIKAAGVADHVEPHREYSTDVARTWSRPIRFLWIDGDHTYKGAKEDLDGFLPHLVPCGVVAFHDALSVFPGPIRVFVEEVLRSNQFGSAGFVHSIAWAQFRPEDGGGFQKQRALLDRLASRLIPFVESGNELQGLTKIRYKLSRSRIPRFAVRPSEWAESLDRPSRG